MFANLQECLEVYKKELKDYKNWVIHGKNLNYEEIQSWQMNLRGMEQVLGLTKEEINVFWNEVDSTI